MKIESVLLYYMQQGAKSLAGALNLLKFFVAERREERITELAITAGLHKSLVSRILRTFADYGFVQRPADVGVRKRKEAAINAAAIFSLVLFHFTAQVGVAGAQDAPFKGKTVRVIVGFPPGGGADAEGRVLARHLGKYVPGNPTFIVQNMPGAGGLTASNWFEDLAKPDGSTLYYCVGSTAVTQQAFGMEGLKYDLRGWEMIGSVDRATSVVLLRPDKMERLTDKSKPPLGIGARTGDDAWSTMFLWGAEYLNWNVRWILGYQGGGELRLAFERGETDLYATANLITLRELIAAGFRPLTQQGSLTSTGSFRRRPEFKDVPTFDEILGKRRPTGDAWTAYVTWAGSDAVGRPLFAPRKTSSAMVQQLRDAFGKLESDKEFMAELKKVGGDDADLLLAKEAEPVLRQVLTVTPGVQEFVKNITKKHLQR